MKPIFDGFFFLKAKKIFIAATEFINKCCLFILFIKGFAHHLAAGLPGHLHGAPDWRGALGGGRPFQPVQFFQQPHHHFAPHMLNTMERHLSPRISSGKNFFYFFQKPSVFKSLTISFKPLTKKHQ